jgi:hypothetical protein
VWEGKDSQLGQSYEFYRLLYAATSLHEHIFNLRDNLRYLNDTEKNYIKSTLLGCHSYSKMRSFIHELRLVDVPPEWINEIGSAYIKNIRDYEIIILQNLIVTGKLAVNYNRIFAKKIDLNNTIEEVYAIVKKEIIYPQFSLANETKFQFFIGKAFGPHA